MVREINMNHICKIEGHASLTLKIDNSLVTKCELKATEGARFFEALVLGRKVEDVQEIVSRICGICSSAHTVASIQALEEALHIQPSEQQKFIREMLMIGERIRSHSTHLYFLTLPDYYNASSALTLNKKHKDKINKALELITLGNKIVETFGGREIHPFLKINKELQENQEKNLQGLSGQLEKSKTTVQETIKLFAELSYPVLERQTDYLSLKEKEDYAIISGKIVSASGLIEDDDYKKHLTENIKEYATSKFVLQGNKPFMTGAMSRLNNNYNNLDNETKETINNLKIKIPLSNPHYNNLAQAIELLQALNRAIKMIQSLPQSKKADSVETTAGKGVSAVEAPRGTLFHEYQINKQGKIHYCNIITPTAQNLNMIEQDIISLVNQLLKEKKTKEQIINHLEKLIRAYDPCFSCSTHFLQVKWL